MYCTSCGTEFIENAKFCTKCGVKKESSTHTSNHQSTSQSVEPNTLTMTEMLFSFEGRIRRSIFWLYNISLAICIGIINAVSESIQEGSPFLVVVLLAVYILLFWAFFAVWAKRWHDRGKSGWNSLITLIPIVSLLALIECGFFSGDEGDNQFGAPQA